MNEKCFALRKDCTCFALAVNNCIGYLICPFYKPIWKQGKIQKQVDMRLCVLPAKTQTAIADKYYNGEMPWGRGKI